MDLLFYRYRHVAVLLVAILAQLGLLAYQVRSDNDVRLIRVWAVSAVTPFARVLDAVRAGTSEFVDDYLLLIDVRRDNQRLKKELGATQLELQHMRAELETGKRAEALALFQKETPMKTIPARIIMNATGTGTAVFVDVGSVQGVQRGMAVITPAGIVGKITGVYPTASMVLLMNDPLFAAGVVSQKNHVLGTLRGQGSASPIVDFVQNEQTVEVDEWFYTSGNDFIFPRGLRVGAVVVAKNGTRRKDIQVKPSGFDNGVEEVLIVTSGVHAPIPNAPAPSGPVSLQAPPKEDAPVNTSASPAAVTTQPVQTGPVATDADRLVERYRNSGTVKSAPKPAASVPPATPPAGAAPSPSTTPLGAAPTAPPPSVKAVPQAPQPLTPSAPTAEQP